MITAEQQFDSTALIDFAIEGTEVAVRFPSDAEALEYVKAFQILSKVSRGPAITRRIGGVEADRALVAHVRQGQGEPLTNDQIEFIARRLADAGVISQASVAGTYSIELRFLSELRSRFTLRLPSQLQLNAMRGCFQNTYTSGGFTRHSIHYDRLLALYDELSISTEGYLHGAPVIHKLKMMAEMSGHLLGARKNG